MLKAVGLIKPLLQTALLVILRFKHAQAKRLKFRAKFEKFKKF